MQATLQSPVSSHLRALESLLDDPSPAVREAVVAEIKRLGDPAVQWLEEIACDNGAPMAPAAEELLEQVAVPGAVAACRRYIRSGQYDLEKGAALLQRVVHPRLDPSKVSAALDAIAHRAQELIAVPTTPSMVVRAINRVIFHELGYRGESDADPDPATVLIGDVLALRRGIPLSMGILYLLVARRLGLNFDPILLPNRLLLANFRDREPFLVDPFSRGRFFSWEEAQVLIPIQTMMDLQRSWPGTAAALLHATCSRLAQIFAKRGETERAEVFALLNREFDETLGQ